MPEVPVLAEAPQARRVRQVRMELVAELGDVDRVMGHARLPPGLLSRVRRREGDLAEHGVPQGLDELAELVALREGGRRRRAGEPPPGNCEACAGDGAGLQEGASGQAGREHGDVPFDRWWRSAGTARSQER